MGYILALDQGTTSSRGIVFDETLNADRGHGAGRISAVLPAIGLGRA